MPADAPAAQPSPLRLHLGGWQRKEGWTIVDVEQRPEVDVVGSCTDLSRFGDASADEVYASHVYEHLDYNDELTAALTEARRVLRPGGLLKIGVPDLEVLGRLIAAPGLTLQERFEVQRMIYGGQKTPFDYHKSGYTFDLLRALLEDCGFAQVKRVKSFGLFSDTTEQKFKGMPISLNVVATRPG